MTTGVGVMTPVGKTPLSILATSLVWCVSPSKTTAAQHFRLAVMKLNSCRIGPNRQLVKFHDL
jgi:hypothetical protein